MSDPRIEELWQAVLEGWSEDAAHQAFIEHCRVTQQLGEAAARYRSEARDEADPERAAAARKRLEAIALLAVFELSQTRSAATPTAASKAVSYVAALVLLGIIVLATSRFLTR